jgi:branched-chain amino acid transport system substrate-binding protein
MMHARSSKQLILVILTLFVGVALAVSVPGSAAAGAARPTGQPLKIGIIAPTTGGTALIGQHSVEGAKMAAEEINAGGGLGGRPIEILAEDEAGQPAVGVAAMNKLVYSDKVNVILGPDTSSVTLAAMNIPQRESLPQITSSLNPTITQQNDPWIFRMRPTDLIAADLMARFGVEELKLKKIGVMNSRGDYGQGGADAFVAALKRGYNMAPIRSETVNIGDKDFTPQLLNIKNSGADGLLWWGIIAETAIVLKQRHDIGFTGPIFGANALVNSTVLDLAGQNADGAIAATNYANTNPDPKTVEFEKKFRAKFNKVPNDHAPLYYDAMYLLREAVKLGGGTSGEQIAKGLHLIRNLRLITSKFSFDEKGEPGNSMLIVQVKGTQQIVLKAYNYD